MDWTQIRKLLSVPLLLFVLFCSTASAICPVIYYSEDKDNCLDPQLVPNELNSNIIMLIESEVERDDCTLPPTVPPTTPSKPQDTTPPPTEPSTQSPVTDAATNPPTTKPTPSNEPPTPEVTNPPTTPPPTPPATNGTFQNPASSCKYIPAGSPSGLYWISGSQSATQQYCDMGRSCCGSTGGWMRVVDIDMTVPNQQCPSGFTIYNSGGVLSCRSPFSSGCTSTTFELNSIEYNKVCGRVIGYQFGDPDAFGGGFGTINDIYVDGISLTYGSPRNHIWTFAASVNEALGPTSERCPCSNPTLSFSSAWIPSFIGQDYFCDTAGGDGTSSTIFFSGNPLWDGQGCSTQSNCCTRNNPPWFCKQLSSSTRDSIELRLCRSAGFVEQTPFKIVEIYVQ